MPAYNAALTLEQTLNEINRAVVDDIILVDDASSDSTFELAKRLGIPHVIKHEKNLGYGGNQKTCYKKALDVGADIVIMLHPDYQYSPKLIPSMVDLIATGVYPVVIGSRILGGGALKGGMPLYKYFSNRVMTMVQNILQNMKLSEYHTGYRAYDAAVLRSIAFEKNSNDFVFDNQLLSQVAMKGFQIGEISCPTRYFEAASSINFARSITYGSGCMYVALRHFLHKNRLLSWDIYS